MLLLLLLVAAPPSEPGPGSEAVPGPVLSPGAPAAAAAAAAAAPTLSTRPSPMPSALPAPVPRAPPMLAASAAGAMLALPAGPGCPSSGAPPAPAASAPAAGLVAMMAGAPPSGVLRAGEAGMQARARVSTAWRRLRMRAGWRWMGCAARGHAPPTRWDAVPCAHAAHASRPRSQGAAGSHACLQPPHLLRPEGTHRSPGCTPRASARSAARRGGGCTQRLWMNPTLCVHSLFALRPVAFSSRKPSARAAAACSGSVGAVRRYLPAMSLLSYRSDVGSPGYTGYIASPQRVVLPQRCGDRLGRHVDAPTQQKATTDVVERARGQSQ